MAPTHRFIQLTDLHLSDTPHTPAHQVLAWAVDHINEETPDLLAVSGDIVTYGTSQATHLFLDALKRVRAPVFFTPGNAEHRRPQALALLASLCSPSARITLQNDLLYLFPDTSQGTLSQTERVWLDQTLAHHPAVSGCALITHYPAETLDHESQNWLENWIQSHPIELLVCGHRHIHQTRQIGRCLQVITRGLDPDKASGDLPGLSVFERSVSGQWSETFHPWTFPIQLLPPDLPDPILPVGWSIQGDPVEAIRETLDLDLACLEFRPKTLDYDLATLKDHLQSLQDRGPCYLSWHLPNLQWNPETDQIDGASTLQAHIECARGIGVHHFTVHVPQAPASTMMNPEPTELWRRFEEAYENLFRETVSSGIRLAIENVHNPTGMKEKDPDRKFATRIGEYSAWIEAVRTKMADIPNAQIGAHFDVGHARNNGDWGNIQPLGDWYAHIGKYILGYHIHQVGKHPETGKTANHLEIHTPFSLRVSYAGFIHAWSTRQINRAPLFVEIRDADQRWRTTRRLKTLFENAERIRQSTDLPGRSEDKS